MKEEKGPSLVECPNNHLYNRWKYGDKCPNCGALFEGGVKETDEKYLENLMIAPEEWVCGWLVCVSGINKGKSYTIKTGKNFVGTSLKMEICIKGDDLVLKENHSVIAYDEQSRKFLILGTISLGLVYVNQRVVYENTIVTPSDVIEFGNSKFVITGFCGIDRTWDEY